MDLTKCNLESLRDDGEFVLYRVRQRSGGDPVLALIPRQATFTSLRRLEHEHGLAAELDPSWAARPIALIPYKERMTLLIEDTGGEPLDRLLGRPLELGQFLHLAVALTALLSKMHRHGLVHKDIKPANVLVDAGGGLRLTGFGIASRQAREQQPPPSAEIISGTLAYMAPEQTGRMNRPVDARSDLYSFGVTLYEMLTGRLPFAASDPMEWVHCHVARLPVPPSERAPGTPAQLCAIVVKLLAKNPEDRYQTAQGLEFDLRQCLADWESRGHIREFPLAVREISNRLQIPKKLYGRDHEIKALLASFDRVVTTGAAELVLVSGYSGVGKSALVSEAQQALAQPRRLFAAGKFDVQRREIPYAALAQAFQSLIRQILAKDDDEVSEWRQALQEALGTNGQLIVNLMPELELILGKQPPTQGLPPQDMQNHFRTVFQRFIGVFTQPGRPLVLFLDDLQWLDTATLDLIGYLATEPDVRHLLLIGAYRANEVDPSHRLQRTLQEIRGRGARVEEIALAPLAHEDVVRLVAETLHCNPKRARPLAALVFEKTGGNPFFAIQFVMTLAEESLLAFDAGATAWSWDMQRIRAKNCSDNVADLMATKLNLLPGATIETMRQLACLGSSAEIATLALARGESEEDLHLALRQAVLAGLVVRRDDSYAFLHDRVQEAAYALIPESDRPEAHLRIGRLLVHLASSEQLEKRIFLIVSQFNRGITLITTASERMRVVELNLMAGKWARTTTAYASAIAYLTAAQALLGENRSKQHRGIAFAIEFLRAECEFLTGDMAVAETRLLDLSARCADVLARAEVTRLTASLYTVWDRPTRAVAVCLDYLRRVGIRWSEHPVDADVDREWRRFRKVAARHRGEAAEALPLMTDAATRATMSVLADLLAAASFTDVNLNDLLILRAATLSLECGLCDMSCLALVCTYGAVAIHYGDYAAGYRFAKLGFDLAERHGQLGLKARVDMCFAAVVLPWEKPAREARPVLHRAFEIAQKTGDLGFAAFSRRAIVSDLLFCGEKLQDVRREAEDGLTFARRVKFGLAADAIEVQCMLVRSLLGLGQPLAAAQESGRNAHWAELHHANVPHWPLAAFSFWTARTQLEVLVGDHDAAVDAAERAKALRWASRSYLEAADYEFYAALAHAAACGAVSEGRRQAHLDALHAHYRQIEIWAGRCPINFANRLALIGAEIARLEGRELDAERSYEDAIRWARAAGFVHNEAIASECAARFQADRGFEMMATAYLGNARNCYLRWGAIGKVRQLDQAHPRLAEPPLPFDRNAIFDAFPGQLDIGTMFKAAQALSREIVLGTLITTLMRVVVEHAGAERGILFLLRGGEARIAAEATTDRNGVNVSLLETSDSVRDFPESALHYVIRTQESLTLDDAAASNLLSEDRYVQQRRPKSLLCLPIISQAKLIGVLYLENNLVARAFTPDRIATLELLASQAAISLENARLYSDLQRSEAFLAEGQRMSHTGSWSWNVPSGQLVWSEENYVIFGWKPQDVPAPTLEMFLGRVHPEDQPLVRQTLQSAIRDRISFAFDFRISLSGGVVKYLHAVGRPLVSESERVNDYIGTTMDVSERKRREVELRDVQAELARAARLAMMGELTTMIAHEVNQPLMAVVASADACLSWLARSTPDLDEARQAAERIARNGHRAGGIINSIRAMAKKSKPTMAPLDINEAVGEILALLGSEFHRRNVMLEAQLSADIGPVMGDRVQLQQVILNLVMNGIEAMNTIEDRPRLLRVRSQGNQSGDVLIAVRDTGTGLDPDKMDRLFDAFFTTKAEGMGMGLAVCRSIIEAHGGVLWASANPPHGSVFQFTVPARVREAVPSQGRVDGSHV
jgi:predicted ATPase/signal transduction histidine kinase